MKHLTDEEAAMQAYTLDIGEDECDEAFDKRQAFLAGCNRYRPIVEELLAAIKNAKEMRRVGYGLLGDVELIARAEKMLGDKK